MLSTQVKLMSLALLSAVLAEPIPFTERSIFPSWSCPGPNQGQPAYNIKTQDMEALATAIHTNTLSSGSLPDSILIKGNHGINIKAGSVQVCVQNNYLFENAHYARNDIALAVAEARYNCCGGQTSQETLCNVKPWLTMKGDTGLKAYVTVGKAGDPCKGAPSAADYLSDGEIVYKTGKLFWDIFAPIIKGEP